MDPRPCICFLGRLYMQDLGLKKDIITMFLNRLMGILITLVAGLTILGFVERKSNQVFIVDQTGKKWDVSQAESLGFNPQRFQYGIGKNAFTTLNDSHVKADSESLKDHSRVIGIKNETASHAYSVGRLRYHEIANTHIGDKPIAAGY